MRRAQEELLTVPRSQRADARAAMVELETELNSKVEALKVLLAAEDSEPTTEPTPEPTPEPAVASPEVEPDVDLASAPSGSEDPFLVGPAQKIVDRLRAKSIMELQRLLDLGAYTKEWQLTAVADAGVEVYQHCGNPSLVKACFPAPGVPPGIALEVLTNDAQRGSWDPTFGQVLQIEKDELRGQDYI